MREIKEPGDSFSDVILRAIPRPCATAGEMLDAFENVELPPMNKRRMALLRAGRGQTLKQSANCQMIADTIFWGDFRLSLTPRL